MFRPAEKASLEQSSHFQIPAWLLNTGSDLSIFLLPTGNLATSRARVTAASRSLPPQLGSGRSKVSLSAHHAVWEAAVVLFVALRHSTLKTQLKKKKENDRNKNRAVGRSLVIWPPCYVCCALLVVMQRRHLATVVGHIKEAPQVY